MRKISEKQPKPSTCDCPACVNVNVQEIAKLLESISESGNPDNLFWDFSAGGMIH